MLKETIWLDLFLSEPGVCIVCPDEQIEWLHVYTTLT